MTLRVGGGSSVNTRDLPRRPMLDQRQSTARCTPGRTAAMTIAETFSLLDSRLHKSRLGAFAAAHPDWTWAGALLLLGGLIYLPRLGGFPLWDPWEPHYSQVAWEMQQHDTW